jgi:hypothetical protein
MDPVFSDSLSDRPKIRPLRPYASHGQTNRRPVLRVHQCCRWLAVAVVRQILSYEMTKLSEFNKTAALNP